MAKRTPEELSVHPCHFKLKDFEKAPTNGQKVERIIPNLDADGNQIYKEVEVTVKKACGCKNKNGTPQTEVVKQKVPDTKRVMIDAPMSNENSQMVICKLYGTVAVSHCQGCHTYKAKPQ